MLTPAEELGLSGVNLASRVRRAFFRIPEEQLVELMQRMREEALRRHLIYLRDGEPEAIRVMPCPVTVLPDQLAYLHYVSLTIHNALKRLPELYMQDFAVREVLRLSAGRGAMALGLLGAEPPREQPGLRPARRRDRLHQPDVEGLAASSSSRT